MNLRKDTPENRNRMAERRMPHAVQNFLISARNGEWPTTQIGNTTVHVLPPGYFDALDKALMGHYQHNHYEVEEAGILHFHVCGVVFACDDDAGKERAE